MKIIITETQKEFIYALRRVDKNWDWISDIVKEGLDYYNPCDYESSETYLDYVSKNSAETYTLNCFSNPQDEHFPMLYDYVLQTILETLSDEIIDWYNYKKEECE